MTQFSISNLQFTMNYQLANSNEAASNCKSQIVHVSLIANRSLLTTPEGALHA